MKRFSAAALILLGALAICHADEIPLQRASLASFPHQLHQKALGGCSNCHTGSEPGKIEEFSKEWAHSTCMGCHSDMQRGPVKCGDCHTTY